MRDEKLHAVVARSTFPSQNAQSTPWSEHFWTWRCRKSARHCSAKDIFKSKCTKHTSFGPLLEVEMSKKCTPLWREAHFEMYKTLGVRTTFGSWDVEKVHAVVARSTFGSQNVQNTRGSDHFWRSRCRKKCTPLWREAHFEVKMYKTLGVRTTFGRWDVEKVHAVVVRSTFRSQNVKNTRGSDHFWKFRCRFASLHYNTLHYTTIRYTPLHYTTLHYTTLHNTTTITTQLHSTTLHYTKLHYTTLHYTTLHYITLHYTPLHYNYTYDYTTTLHYTKLHYTTLHYTTLHYIPLHSLHYTNYLHYTTLHWMTLHHR